MRGIWAAALNPFNADGSFNEKGLRSNIRHWIDDLDIQGLFIAGKQGEFFSMSLKERKRNFEIAVEECNGKAGTIMSVSDQNVNTVLELALHAQNCGADYIVVHAPVLSFCHDRDEVLYNYYKYLCDRLEIGIAMWSHPDSGYLMEPETCACIADLPNIVAAVSFGLDGRPLIGLAQKVIDEMNSATLVAVPLFVIAAKIMDAGGTSRV